MKEGREDVHDNVHLLALACLRTTQLYLLLWQWQFDRFGKEFLCS